MVSAIVLANHAALTTMNAARARGGPALCNSGINKRPNTKVRRNRAAIHLSHGDRASLSSASCSSARRSVGKSGGATNPAAPVSSWTHVRLMIGVYCRAGEHGDWASGVDSHPERKDPMTDQPMTPPVAPAAAPTPPAATPPEPGAAKPMVTFDEFAKLDLRVARVVAAENHPNADKLLKLQLDDGSGVPRQICAGIRAQYTPEQMVGRLIIIVANLAPRKIRGEESRGMLLAASDLPKDAAAATGAERKVIVLRPDADIAPGSIVS